VSLHEAGDGGFQFLSLPYIPSIWRCADFVRKSLAEWCSRALGGQLPQRAARPCDCSKRAAPEAVAFRIRLLLSRGPQASWTGKGNTGGRTRCETFGSVLSHDRLGGLHTVTIRRPNPKTEGLILYICVCFVGCEGRQWLACASQSGRSALRSSVVYTLLLMQFWIVARHNGRSYILSVLSPG